MRISRHERTAETEVQLSEFFPPLRNQVIERKRFFPHHSSIPCTGLKNLLEFHVPHFMLCNGRLIRMFRDLFLDSHVAMFLSLVILN
jgi:hypothetical protein